MIEELSYEHAGTTFRGVIQRPAVSPPAARHGGVLIVHGGGGLSAHERERVAYYAAHGYVAYAADMFGEVFADRARGMAVIGGLLADPPLLRARARAALRTLADRTEVDAQRLAVVGHCFGGYVALELARDGAPVRAAISLHGRLVTAAPARVGEMSARVLACTGADDPFCTRADRTAFEDEMTAARVDWQHHVYGGVLHGFSVPSIDAATTPGCAYNADADRRSSAATLALLAETIGAAA